jgi:glycosyltransferase involved in cell wall biosynthesis
MSVLFIGRLDSYKRVDWLLQALADVPQPWRLDVVGDGPKHASLQTFARELFGASERVQFHGRLNEAAKLHCLAQADLLVLPSDRSNEAFGIVQLEAMAAAIPALAFQRRRSGMGWVGALPQLSWSQQPQDLAEVLRLLQAHPQRRAALGLEARARYLRLFQRRVWRQQLTRFDRAV